MRYPLSQPSIGPGERCYAYSAIESGWISGRGEFVERFEFSLCDVTGRSYALATSSGTAALEVLLQALGIGHGDEVIVSALTFVSPVAAVVNCGGTPVLCDINESTWTIDVEMAGRLITPQTRAIIAVSIMGHPCDFARLEELGVAIIEDAAEAHGSGIGNQPSGSFGVASIFSFHANKAVTSGEGGAILTDDEELMESCRTIANHGMDWSVPYVHSVYGRNARLNNVSAAIGFGQVERWGELTAARLNVSRLYESHLSSIDGVTMRPFSPVVNPSCWLACFSVDDIAPLVEAARHAGVDVRRIWPAISSLPLYEKFVVEPCVVAEKVSSHAAWLPTWAHMNEREVADIVRTVWT